MSVLLVTGSAGLVGSAVSEHFHALGWDVHGVDAFRRALFFGPSSDTRPNQERLVSTLARFTSHEIDIRDRAGIEALVSRIRPDAVVHAAAPPSHDKAAEIPFEDFEINAVGTLNVLEAVRRHSPRAAFVHLSTNKVYGDRPNALRTVEGPTRWDYADPQYAEGIAEDFPVDASTHSLFGASKLAADVLVQEYGRYFGMSTACLRGGCLTGPHHAASELHGFLSYLVWCNLTGTEYVIRGYKGKQVRDNLHARDVASFAEAFVAAPRKGEVYNLGGGRANACSVLEAIALSERATGRPLKRRYVDENRKGDHLCYISDLRKARRDYPGWDVRTPLDRIVAEIVADWKSRLPGSH